MSRLTKEQVAVKLDCGDNSCFYTKKISGMRTNGGCRCLRNAGFHKSATASTYEMLPEVISLREEVTALRAEHDEMIEKCAKALEQHYDGSDVGDETVNGFIVASVKIIRALKSEPAKRQGE